MPEGSGILYLATYGFMQALVVQQDAVRDLCTCLSVAYDPRVHPILGEIREIRNATAGHPTSNERNPDGLPYHFIVRVSLAQGHFELFSRGDNARRQRKIDCLRFATEQQRCLANALETALQEMEARDASHRTQFASDLLEPRLSPVIYWMQNVFESLERSDCHKFGCAMLDLVEKAMVEFRDALQARGITVDTYDGIKSAYGQVGYPLNKLRTHLSGGETIDSEAAFIFAKHLCDQLDSLRSFAKEIDAEYRGGWKCETGTKCETATQLVFPTLPQQSPP
jgi:hypothetical protein